MDKTKKNATRRAFIKSAGSMTVGGSLAFGMPLTHAFGKGKEVLKVGLIGCGGRGTGAANQALVADNDVVLWAMGDVFNDRLEDSHNNLRKLHTGRIKVDKKRKFVGFDAYKEVIGSGVDVVILTTPPAFRPDHLTAAIDAGKHVFCEKPVAVDAQGIRKTLEATKKAKTKNLNLVSGLCWRYDFAKKATFEKVLNGAIGEISTIYNTYNTGALWSKERQPNWSGMEYKLRNWLYYNWLSGDHLVEQAVHSLDWMSWAMGDRPPLRVSGTGGRQSRVAAIYGNVYDHFALVYEYENGVKGFHFSRQQQGCDQSYMAEIAGTNGMATVDAIKNKHNIQGTGSWSYDGKQNNMYQSEHDELFAAIRNGKSINDGDRMALSTMLAIAGRMAAYSGKTITWDEAINSDVSITPHIDDYSWGLQWNDPAVAKPGFTEPF